MSTYIEEFSLTNDGSYLRIKWTNGKTSNFYSMWLRFNCRCDECHEHESNMNRYKVDEIPMEMKISKVTITDNDMLRVQWDLENHVAEFDPDYLERNCYSRDSLTKKRLETKPVITSEVKIPEISYLDVLDSNNGLYKWLRTINEDGLCLLRNVATEDKYVKKVMELVGPIQKTIYGETYDIRPEEVPINVGYTKEALAFHMDQQQYESAPGIQFLHCLQFDPSIKGGETAFVDMFSVAEHFRQKYPDHFKTLCTVPATFQRIHRKQDNIVKMIVRKPHILVNNQEEIIGISWHPILIGPLAVGEEYVESYYKAFQLFAKEIRNSKYSKEIRLQPGDLISYNNRRMAHARNVFEGNGIRHLQGGYVSTDDYKNKLMSLAELLDDKRPIKRIFNNDWF